MHKDCKWRLWSIKSTCIYIPKQLFGNNLNSLDIYGNKWTLLIQLSLKKNHKNFEEKII